jgi:anti-sigma B factor antagonist
MQVRTTLGPVTVLSISGDIDSVTSGELVKQANEVLSGGHTKLVLDLGGVDFISSGGLVAMQTIAGQAATRGGKMVICCVDKHVAQVLRITAFDKILSVYPDVAAAKASFE